MRAVFASIAFFSATLAGQLCHAADREFPVVDGMALYPGDFYQSVKVRAKSFGPGGCAVEFTLEGRKSGFMALPHVWSPWTPIQPSLIGASKKTLGFRSLCDTGVVAQVKYAPTLGIQMLGSWRGQADYGGTPKQVVLTISGSGPREYGGRYVEQGTSGTIPYTYTSDVRIRVQDASRRVEIDVLRKRGDGQVRPQLYTGSVNDALSRMTLTSVTKGFTGTSFTETVNLSKQSR